MFFKSRLSHLHPRGVSVKKSCTYTSVWKSNVLCLKVQCIAKCLLMKKTNTHRSFRQIRASIERSSESSYLRWHGDLNLTRHCQGKAVPWTFQLRDVFKSTPTVCSFLAMVPRTKVSVKRQKPSRQTNWDLLITQLTPDVHIADVNSHLDFIKNKVNILLTNNFFKQPGYKKTSLIIVWWKK